MGLAVCVYDQPNQLFCIDEGEGGQYYVTRHAECTLLIRLILCLA